MTLNIIDTHQHLWDLDRLYLPWVKDVPELNKSFGQSDYQKYTSAAQTPSGTNELDYEIAQTIYMEVDVAESDMQKELELILETCRNSSNCLAGMVGQARPGTAGFDDSLEFAKSNPEIKGFRRVLHTEATPKGTCLETPFQESICRLADQTLTFDICIRREELSDAAELAAACPETQLVLDHCGNADARMTNDEFDLWKRGIQTVARHDNVICKVSGFVWTIQDENWSYEKDIEPILRVVFDSFGEDRILFGGDWPVCTLSKVTFPQWVDAINRFAKECGASVPEKLFADNAKRVYRV